VVGRAPLRADVEAGQAVYSPLALAAYDALVLGFSNRYVWRLPVRNDAGPATTSLPGRDTSTPASGLAGSSTNVAGEANGPRSLCST
jgi:hypothetical protein